MAKVRCISIDGIEMWFYSGDHQPPHFHARRLGDWEVRVYITAAEDEMLELVRPPDALIKGKDRKALINGVLFHRSELLAEWEDSQAD
jgi:hypothetical protein